MATDLPTYIPLREAAERYGVARKSLTQLVDSGRIRAVKINGGFAVAEEDVIDTTVRREDFEHLHGLGISIAEASRKYDVPYSTLHGWMERQYIRVLGPGERQQGRAINLNEHDVAYRAALYHQLKEMRGAGLLEWERPCRSRSSPVLLGY